MFAFCIDAVRIMAIHEHPFMGIYSILIICALLQSRRGNQSLPVIFLHIIFILQRAIYVKGRKHEHCTDFSVR